MTLSSALLACSLAVASPQSPPPPQVPRVVLLDDAAELGRALASQALRRGIAVRVRAVSLPGETPATVRVLVVAEIGAGSGAPPLASVAYALRDDRERIAARALRRGELRGGLSGAPTFLEVITLRPGRYTLKLAALVNDQIGTAETALVAREQTAGGLRLGDLVAGDSPAEDPISALAVQGSVRGGRLVVSLPLAAEAALPPDLAIRVEVAKDPMSAALLSGPAAVLAGDGRTRLAQADIDAGALPAGQYCARAIVSIGGRETARVSGTFSVDRAAGAPAGGGTAAAAAFRPEDALDPAALGPFLDELAVRAPDRSRPAIGQARAGRFLEAANAAASADSSDPTGPFLQGLSFYSQGQWQAASEAFRQTIRAAPDFLVGAFYIGACYAAGGRDPQAINAWQTSLVSLDQYPVVFRMLGDAMMRAGQAGQAVTTLEEAVGKWPDDPALRIRLARAALAARRYDLVLTLSDATLAGKAPDLDLLLAGMQAIFEQVSQAGGPAPDDALARMRRYRDAYNGSGGPQQALVSAWMAAIEKMPDR